MPTSAHENGDRQSTEEFRVAKPNPSTAEHDRARLSATAGVSRLPGHSHQLESTFPVTHSLSEHDSACLTDPLSPVIASTGSAALLRAKSSDPLSITAARNVLEQDSERDILIRSSSQRQQPTDASTTSPPCFCISHYHTSISSNQPTQKPIRLPSITREGRIVSLDESYKQDGTNYVGSSPSLVNGPGFSQALLQPLQSLAHISSLLSHSFQVPSSDRQPQELWHSSFAALVRAGELVRIIDAEAEDKKGSL
jgi:hypothetical protein